MFQSSNILKFIMATTQLPQLCELKERHLLKATDIEWQKEIGHYVDRSNTCLCKNVTIATTEESRNDICGVPSIKDIF